MRLPLSKAGANEPTLSNRPGYKRARFGIPFAAWRVLQTFELAPRPAQVNLSTPLVLEYEAVLKRPGMIKGFSDAAVDTFLDGLCAIANQHDIFYLWRP